MNKKITLAIIIAIAVLVSCIKIYKPEQEIGKSVSMFELQTIDGETVSPCSMKGKNVVLVFFNTWCPDCHETLPVIQEWMDEDTQGKTTYLCIAREQNNDEIIPFWEENGYTMMAAGDPKKEVYDLFTGGNPYGVPLVYLIDQDGIVRKRILQNEKLSKN